MTVLIAQATSDLQDMGEVQIGDMIYELGVWSDRERNAYDIWCDANCASINVLWEALFPEVDFNDFCMAWFVHPETLKAEITARREIDAPNDAALSELYQAHGGHALVREGAFSGPRRRGDPIETIFAVKNELDTDQPPSPRGEPGPDGSDLFEQLWGGGRGR